jgi:hypothetical protein
MFLNFFVHIFERLKIRFYSNHFQIKYLKNYETNFVI